MYKDGFDLVGDIISLIALPEVLKAIDGVIRPSMLMTDMDKTNIVVGCIVINNEAFQEGIATVKIITPDIISTIGGKIKSLPNQKELKRISDLLTPLLDAQNRDSLLTEVVDFRALHEYKPNCHCSVIRVKYYSIQTNFKNI